MSYASAAAAAVLEISNLENSRGSLYLATILAKSREPSSFPPTAPAIFAAFLVPLQTKVAGESLLADLALEALDSDRSVLVLGVPG